MKKVDNRPDNPDQSMWTFFGIVWLLITIMIVWNLVTF